SVELSNNGEPGEPFRRLTREAEQKLMRLDAPRPHHLPHYFKKPWHRPEEGCSTDEAGEMLGRKLYRHRRNQDFVEGEVWVADKRCKIEFEVAFENLTGEELGLLAFTLDLTRAGGPPGLTHHFGYSKPAGYGSIRI